MEHLNKYISGAMMPIMLIIFGLYFAFKLKFFYILHPFKTLKTILKNQKGGFRALSVALAGTLGVGNIVGVASAISMGGAGSVFWMWVSAICAMSLKYTEVYLAMIFRRQKNGKFFGGAHYYIKDGLKNTIGAKWSYLLSILFALFCIINSLSTGNLVQINSVSELLPIKPIVFGIVFAVVAFIAIRGGYKRISKITSVMIPVLSSIYILLCLFIIFYKFNNLPHVLSTIFRDAFNIKSALCGFCGYGIGAAVRYGVSRGLLSNEAGCGTSPCAHAASENNDPHSQGSLGVFEVFIDTIVLCSLTAFVILLSSPCEQSSPMGLVLSAFEEYTGKLGSITIIIISIMFAFATVISQFFYGAEAVEYISNKKYARRAFSAIFCLVAVTSAIIPQSLMWGFSDLAIALMTITNLICLFLLIKKHPFGPS